MLRAGKKRVTVKGIVTECKIGYNDGKEMQGSDDEAVGGGMMRDWKDKTKGMSRLLGAALIAGALLLGGCGEFPGLNEEQIERAGEYAAMTLLKYDSQNRRRLMSLEDMEAEEARRESWRQAAREAARDDTREREEEGTRESAEQTGSFEENSGSYGNLSDGFLLPDGALIEYRGFFLCDIYPQEDSSYFAIVAREGKKNLVLRFLLKNDADGSNGFDMAGQDNSYVITVNGNYARVPYTTMLDNDLSNYQGRLMPGASEELVLLIEVDEDTVVSSLKMKIKNDRIESTILLEP